MQNSFNKAQFVSRQITENDWWEYKHFCARMHGQEHLGRMLGGKDPENPANWQDWINNGGYVLFGLYHDTKMVGSSAILFRQNEAVFTGIMIDPDYRRQGLADHLHNVRKRHLDSIKFDGFVTTEILPTNTSSIAAAERNGFQSVGTKESDGVPYRTFILPQ